MQIRIIKVEIQSKFYFISKILTFIFLPLNRGLRLSGVSSCHCTSLSEIHTSFLLISCLAPPGCRMYQVSHNLQIFQPEHWCLDTSPAAVLTGCNEISLTEHDRAASNPPVKDLPPSVCPRVNYNSITMHSFHQVKTSVKVSSDLSVESFRLYLLILHGQYILIRYCGKASFLNNFLSCLKDS